MFHGGTYVGIRNPQFWFDAARKLHLDPDLAVVGLGDLSSYARNVAPVIDPSYTAPLWEPSVINGLPAIHFTQSGVASGLNILTYEGTNVFPGPVGSSATGRTYPRQVFAVIKPVTNTIGSVVTFRQSTAVFGCDMWDTGSGQFVYDDGVANSAQATATVNYSGTPILIAWQNDKSNIACAVNGVARALSTNTVVSEDGLHTGFSLGRKKTDITSLVDYYLAETICFFGNDTRIYDEQTDRLMTKFAL